MNGLHLWMLPACVCAVAASSDAARPTPVGYYAFAHEGILGTSADLTFAAASPDAAARAERAALDEIERLRRILSTYDSTSEAWRLRVTGRDSAASPELIAVLQQYSAWEDRTQHAYSGRVGALSAAWSAGARQGRTPNPEELAKLTASLRQPGWKIDAATDVVTTAADSSLDLSSLGKGFIIGRAMSAARSAEPSLRGAMINIGGDIYAWGEAPSRDGLGWRIDVADPRRSADNAPPLARLRVREGAVSSSGAYARGYTIGGRHFSHIIDPRTGRPADQVVGATIIARDNATANALATTVSVLRPEDALTLLRTIPGAEAVIVTADGQLLKTPGFAAYEVDSPRTAATVAPSVSHAPHVAATMTVDVTPRGWVRRRPYVAVWITDAAGKHVRTLAMWGDRFKYQRDLTAWWRLVGGNESLVDAVSRATRNTGSYTLEWDGADQDGHAVPAGAYTFWIEVAYQNGPHSTESLKLACGPTKATGTMPSTQAFAGATAECSEAR
ncbi:MAG: apbE 3 [Gemmatimonadetes bacterium]|nr:apbE 3 [Gemmatimonadota bacterium]